MKNNFLGDKDQDMEREREFYEYQHESPPHQMHTPQPQTVHLSPTHPHLRHVGHPQTSIICIQSPLNNPTPQSSIIASNPTSQSPAVQNHTSQSMSEHHIHEIHVKKEAHVMQGQTHFTHHQQNSEMRPSVIESNQPMVIECT